jgi:hypothetical protein
MHPREKDAQYALMMKALHEIFERPCGEWTSAHRLRQADSFWSAGRAMNKAQLVLKPA